MSANDLAIIKVVERFSAKDANKYLECGWKLLNTAPGTDEQGYPLISYILGKTAESKEPELF